jgi:nicotinamide mononucleotide transporter
LKLSAAVLNVLGILAMLTGVGYAVLAARRNRLCWLFGAVSSALIAVVSWASKLPMQAGLQVFFVGMAVYGWLSWTRSSTAGELPVSLWPLRLHLFAAAALTLLSFLSARPLAEETDAAWPLLDSLTVWFSVLATWLVARAKLENWLYWIVIDVVLVFLFYDRGQTWVAMLYVLLIVVASAGFIAWRRRLHAQMASA